MTYFKNAVTLEGFLTHDPKFTFNTYGRPVVAFKMSTQNSYKCSETNEWKKRDRVFHNNLTSHSPKVLKQAESFKKSALVKIKAQLVYDKVIGRGGAYIDVPRLIVSGIQAVELKATKEAEKPTLEVNQKRLAKVLAKARQTKLDISTNNRSQHNRQLSITKVLASVLGALVFFI